MYNVIKEDMMDLFGKDKELVLKLINAVLVIWFIAATIISFNILLNLVVKEEKINFKDYKQVNCIYINEEYNETNCKEMYNSNRRENRSYMQDQKKSFAVGIFNIVIVGTTIYVLNRKKGKK